MGLSSTYQDADDSNSLRTILHALDRGISHLDTADLYGQGHNEQLLGRALKGRRDEAFLSSKFGYRFSTDGTRTIDSTGNWAKQACEDSLRRLATDHLDLYYLHRRNPVTPIEDTMEGLVELQESGKIRHIGLSEVSPNTLRTAHSISPITAVQMEYSLFSRDIERTMLRTCRELGIALVAYAPLGRGWLTGSITSPTMLSTNDSRRAHPRFAEESFVANQQLVAILQSIATELGKTPSQIAIAWILNLHQNVFPIPGTRSLEHLEDNIQATSLQLSSAHIDILTNHFHQKAVKGQRHNPENLRTLGF